MSVYGLEAARFLSRDARVVRGIKQIIPVPNPAAGAELVFKVVGGEQDYIYGGTFTFTASAAVANRTVSVALDVDGARVYRMVDATAIAATGTVNYSVIMSDSPVPVTTQGGVGMFQLPLFPLSQGAQLSTVTANRDVADQFSAINLYVARVYLPDQKLDEIAECEQREYFAAMRKAGLTQGV